MKTIALPNGEQVPALGMGTWHLGDEATRRAEEIESLQRGIDLGLTLIDTAEMYGNGRSEQLVGAAIAGRREKVFLVSKVLPHNAGPRGTIAACERSLRHLRTDRLELYLLHWRGSIPFAETLEALIKLKQAGKIRHYGVSNLDHADMKEWCSLPGGNDTAVNQVLYNLTRRGIEWELLPWLQQRQVPVMAYSPLEEGRLVGDGKLVACAKNFGMSPAQLALAWLLHREQVIAIVKCGRLAHLEEDAGARDLHLSPDQLAELDRLFPPPKGPRALEML